MTSTGVNMLEQMASGLIEEKDAKGRGLTPLVSERLVTPASFPNDLPEDAIRGIIADLVRQHTALGEVIAALQLLVGAEAQAEKAALTDKIKQKEREADARVAANTKDATPPAEVDLVEAFKELTEQEAFDAALAEKTEAAQAATFKPEPSGWQCPEGHDTIEETVSPRGRQFSRCTTCGAFQK